jgi:hypothetical protein
MTEWALTDWAAWLTMLGFIAVAWKRQGSGSDTTGSDND